MNKDLWSVCLFIVPRMIDVKLNATRYTHINYIHNAMNEHEKYLIKIVCLIFHLKVFVKQRSSHNISLMMHK